MGILGRQRRFELNYVVVTFSRIKYGTKRIVLWEVDAATQHKKKKKKKERKVLFGARKRRVFAGDSDGVAIQRGQTTQHFFFFFFLQHLRTEETFLLQPMKLSAAEKHLNHSVARRPRRQGLFFFMTEKKKKKQAFLQHNGLVSPLSRVEFHVAVLSQAVFERAAFQGFVG